VALCRGGGAGGGGGKRVKFRGCSRLGAPEARAGCLVLLQLPAASSVTNRPFHGVREAGAARGRERGAPAALNGSCVPAADDNEPFQGAGASPAAQAAAVSRR